MFSCFSNVVDQASLDLDWRPFPVHVCLVHIQAIFLVKRTVKSEYRYKEKLATDIFNCLPAACETKLMFSNRDAYTVHTIHRQRKSS